MLKIEDLRKNSKEQLLKQISELKGKLLSLRFESSTGQLKESHLINETKKDIAKIFTALKEKEMSVKTTTTKTVVAAKAKETTKVASKAKATKGAK